MKGKKCNYISGPLTFLLAKPLVPRLESEPLFAHRYGGVELSSAGRRKNATRESTSALKAWLHEHRKNPYPTKGEKIMLAIITKMTLTQVSTWFANARRRLKKENKMTWAPKNKGGEERKADSGEDSLGCLNGDTKGTNKSPAHLVGLLMTLNIRSKAICATTDSFKKDVPPTLSLGGSANPRAFALVPHRKWGTSSSNASLRKTPEMAQRN